MPFSLYGLYDVLMFAEAQGLIFAWESAQLGATCMHARLHISCTEIADGHDELQNYLHELQHEHLSVEVLELYPEDLEDELRWIFVQLRSDSDSDISI